MSLTAHSLFQSVQEPGERRNSPGDPKEGPHRLVSYGEMVTRMNVAGMDVLSSPPLF